MILVAPEMEVALKKLKNQIHRIKVKLGPYRSSCHPNSNGVKVTQIQVRINICMVKLLVKLGQVLVTN